MSEVNKSHVRYFLSGSFYTVGNNTTEKADGITDASYSGEIIIEDKINGKEVLEISKYAFQSCKIAKVTIYAKMRSINKCAFRCCTKLKYINIPSSVTFLAELALYVGEPGITEPGEILVEFNKGRTQNFFIDAQNFARRATVYVIYPFTYIPSCKTTYAFDGVNHYYICAPSVFTFYTKQTTTDSSKCPRPVFKEREVYTISIQLRRPSIFV